MSIPTEIEIKMELKTSLQEAGSQKLEEKFEVGSS